jgi:hypothetical protein
VVNVLLLILNFSYTTTYRYFSLACFFNCTEWVVLKRERRLAWFLKEMLCKLCGCQRRKAMQMYEYLLFQSFSNSFGVLYNSYETFLLWCSNMMLA